MERRFLAAALPFLLMSACNSGSSKNEAVARENRSLKLENAALKQNMNSEVAKTESLKQLEEKNEALSRESEEHKAELERLRQQLSERQARWESENSALTSEVADLQNTIATAGRFYDSAMKPYEGIWVAESENDQPSSESCQLFLRVDADTVTFHRIRICDDGKNEMESWDFQTLDSRYHAATSTNALRYRLKKRASSCAVRAMLPEADVYLINFEDGWGDNARPQYAAFTQQNEEHFYLQGTQIPELLRNARCPEIVARANAADASTLLKRAASACQLTLATAGCATSSNP